MSLVGGSVAAMTVRPSVRLGMKCAEANIFKHLFCYHMKIRLIICHFIAILKDKPIDDKLMYILNYDKQNYQFCTMRSLTKKMENCWFVPPNKELMKVPKVDKLKNGYMYFTVKYSR